MSTFVADCPRCHAHEMTFDLVSDIYLGPSGVYDNLSSFEICGVCRKCRRQTLMIIELKTTGLQSHYSTSNSVTKANHDVSLLFSFVRYITTADFGTHRLPDDLPPDIEAAFAEGAKCLTVACPNAASAMFRLCLDLATKALLPPEGSPEEPDKHSRRNLAPRLRWLFDTGRLPADVRALSSVVKDNGDDGAHEGSLDANEAEDIYDFAFALLDRMISEPKRLEAAMRRREERRAQRG